MIKHCSEIASKTRTKGTLQREIIYFHLPPHKERPENALIPAVPILFKTPFVLNAFRMNKNRFAFSAVLYL